MARGVANYTAHSSSHYVTRDTAAAITLHLPDVKGLINTLVAMDMNSIREFASAYSVLYGLLVSQWDSPDSDHNPHHFSSPQQFDPTRWYGVQPEADLTFRISALTDTLVASLRSTRRCASRRTLCV